MDLELIVKDCIIKIMKKRFRLYFADNWTKEQRVKQLQAEIPTIIDPRCKDLKKSYQSEIDGFQKLENFEDINGHSVTFYYIKDFFTIKEIAECLNGIKLSNYKITKLLQNLVDQKFISLIKADEDLSYRNSWERENRYFLNHEDQIKLFKEVKEEVRGGENR